jgi:hypothetical protein
MVPNDIGLTVFGFVGALAGLFIGALVGAVILRAAAKWAEKMEIPFWSAVGTVLVYTLADLAIGMVVALLAGVMGDKPKHSMVHGLVGPVAFLLQSAVISGRHNVTFGKGIKISIFMWLVTLLIGLAVAIITVGVISVMPRF